jgi:hypothetical protein
VRLDGAQDDPDALGDLSRGRSGGIENGEKEASSITARTDPFEEDGQDDDVEGGRCAEPELILT